MEEIKSFDLDRWSEPDEKRQVRHIGMADAKETFEKLEAHLREKGMLPDEYFLYDMDMRTKVKELPDFDFALCVANFGHSEGVYLDIDLIYSDEDGGQKSLRFATGKTLREGADAFFWMSRIAAECSLMLNGRGRTYEKHSVELVLTEEEAEMLACLSEAVQGRAEDPGLEPLHLIFRFLQGKAARRTGVPEARQNLSQSKIGFVKAGIGGFHTAVKQLAGRACNGVIIKDKVFQPEPLWSPGKEQRPGIRRWRRTGGASSKNQHRSVPLTLRLIRWKLWISWRPGITLPHRSWCGAMWRKDSP